MISERVPGQFANHAMVLVQIMAEVGEDEVGHELFLEIFESIFDGSADVGKKTVAEGFYDDGFLASATKKGFGATFSFASAVRIGTKDEPIKFQFV